MTSSTRRILRDIESLDFYREKNGFYFDAWHEKESFYKWNASFVITGFMRDNLISLKIDFPINYPFKGPSIKIVTPFKHSCLASDGSFDIFRDCWSPVFNLGSIIMIIKSKLSEDLTDFHRQRDRVEKYKSELIDTAFKYCHHFDC